MDNKITLGLVHTSATLVPIFQDLCQTYLKDVKVFNIVDDSLIKDAIRRGELTPASGSRVVNHIGAAEAAGADYIMVTGSSIGAAVEALMSGGAATHDRMVSEALKKFSEEVDVILLAQASIARVVDMLDESSKKTPIIPSPPEAVKFLARILNEK